MKKRFALGILFIALAAGAASANVATLRMGYYVPNLKGDFWDIEFEQMSFQKSSFQSVSFGLQYEAFLSRGFSLLLAADVFSKNKGGYYKNWVGYVIDGNAWAFPYPAFNGDFDPNHSITVTSVPVQASLKWTPFGRRGNIIPYVGGGGHVMFWNIRMAGALSISPRMAFSPRTRTAFGITSTRSMTSTSARPTASAASPSAGRPSAD